MSEPVADALAPREEEPDVHFEPVIKLTEQVDTKTHEEDETVLFKMRAKLFRFDSASTEWKERGTGDVRLLRHNHTTKIRLVMRRDKTLKVCANHLITADMKLQPNIGSDRSWVWKVAADYSETPPTSETLAIRFANAENAGEFKAAFEDAQEKNAVASAGPTDGKLAGAKPDEVNDSDAKPSEEVSAQPESGDATKSSESQEKASAPESA